MVIGYDHPVKMDLQAFTSKVPSSKGGQVIEAPLESSDILEKKKKKIKNFLKSH